MEQITELGQLRAKVQWAESRANLLEALLLEARRKHRKEMRGLTAFVGVIACLIAAGACILQAAWWTAVAPLVLMLALLRWVGW